MYRKMQLVYITSTYFKLLLSSAGEEKDNAGKPHISEVKANAKDDYRKAISIDCCFSASLHSSKSVFSFPSSESLLQ